MYSVNKTNTVIYTILIINQDQLYLKLDSNLPILYKRRCSAARCKRYRCERAMGARCSCSAYAPLLRCSRLQCETGVNNQAAVPAGVFWYFFHGNIHNKSYTHTHHKNEFLAKNKFGQIENLLFVGNDLKKISSFKKLTNILKFVHK